MFWQRILNRVQSNKLAMENFICCIWYSVKINFMYIFLTTLQCIPWKYQGSLRKKPKSAEFAVGWLLHKYYSWMPGNLCFLPNSESLWYCHRSYLGRLETCCLCFRVPGNSDTLSEFGIIVLWWLSFRETACQHYSSKAY